MIVSIFSILDKNDRVRFFEESFLLNNVKPDIALRISFPTLSNANLDFKDQNLHRRFYITTEILFIIRKIEPIEKKEFVTFALDSNYKVFVVYVTTINDSFDVTDKMHLS